MRRRIDDVETAALTPNETFGALYLDMDGFKGINDMLGHHAGDAALREAANRIRTVIRSGDIAVRMGGDEFAAFVRNPPNAIALSSVAERLVSALREPFKIEDIDVCACISGGGAVAPHAGTTWIDILRNVDSALYQAKAAGRDGFVVREARVAGVFPRPHTTQKIALPAPPRPKTAIKSYR
jgi:diguanylate cyclase (GGDEF)-like protein